MRIFLFTILVCYVLTGAAQESAGLESSSGISDTEALRVSAPDAAAFTVDNLGNLYMLTSKGLLKKYNNRGDSLNVFNDVRRYGSVCAMDVTNPMKVLLYYRDFSTVVMLDRFLNRINIVDLRKAGIFQAKAVALSYDNNLWVFDEQSAKLKKIGDDSKLLSETVDLRQVLNAIPSPDKIIDRDGFVYLYDKDKGLYIFDYYGALKNELAITGLTGLQVINKTVLGRKDNKFVKYTLGTFDMQEVELPEMIKHAEDIRIMQLGIYVRNSGGIALFKYR
ncbi:hypothetical protein DC498_08410 [Terrimonas sp.]|uniref:hypothetical protein n=1 Tax=Terrimonas sp. TaxID=1914338 RepID=UPI000D51BFDF|nr:hypothetical protein [Terrimonas sp.]PVD52545.1 hypothetical protein DC498_08410 [Terrimonas sp.]